MTLYLLPLRRCAWTIALVILTACGASQASVERPKNDIEPLFWIPSSVPAVAQIDVSRLRRSPYFSRLVEMWKRTAYYNAELLRLIETTSVAYVGMGDLDATPDSTFFIVARGEFAPEIAVTSVDGLLKSGVLGSSAQSARLLPDPEGGWSASYGRVRDDGKNSAHLEELSPGVWALSVGYSPAIRASSDPSPPSPTHRKLMDEVAFASHTIAFVGDTTQIPGDFASTTLVFDLDDAVVASSRQRSKEGISPEPHAERLSGQLSQASVAAAMAGFGSLKDMVAIRAENGVLKIDARVPQDVANKALDMAQSFIVPK